MNLKCLLVDDELIAQKVLRQYISLVEQLELVGVCSNAFQAMEILKTEKVDLIFLDIQLPRLLGTSLIKTLLHPPKVIFVSAYGEYAVEAFELDAVDFLLKPVTLERFLKAVNKVIDKGAAPEGPLPGSGEEFICFRANRKTVKVFLDHIIYIESIKDYIKIYRDQEPPLLVKQSLSALESILSHHLFMRVHRSFIVSIKRITAFTSYDVEIDALEIPIGRRFAAQVKRLSLMKG
ncbi:LytTR family DNA-binding domain-containing protein [Pedobacter sp. PLR]|uniref:LytR/AlgR family response regulator transcription factor n=1 Tax=Pedobacter sp. PLR TaxID=2994465 RepID=UPI00224618CB|nr:LytTR family DNA-binding domain-containing protein [Pedobacter sp. PLR]MCX2453201.1 LytTR family DNA-binding domain-containing protein [Pedobacter sp. PLR]